MTQENNSYLTDLNSEQHRAATHPSGPLLIVAGAGSGKTKTLTSRIAHLIHSGVPANRILAITFTNKAAKEMQERVSKILESGAPAFVGTFHSWGVRFLKEEGRNLARREHFSIFDDDDTLKLLKIICKELDLDKEQYNPLMFRSRISAIKNELRNPAELLETGAHMDEIAHKIFDKYELALAQNNAFDFDDLIEKPVRIFKKFPEILLKHQQRYDHILVDEYQDVNTAQYSLIKMLASTHQNLSVVGDDAQCLLPTSKIETPKGLRAIKNLKIGEPIIAAAGDGEVCTAKILKIHKMNYAGILIKITTESGAVIKLTPNHLIFTRLQLVKDIHFVYLMYRKDMGFRIGIVKGARWGPRGRNQIGLIVRNNQEKADKIWIIKVCKNREEAEFNEFFYAFKYGVPTVVFDTGNRNMKLTQASVTELFSKIDTRERAKKLMSDEFLYFSYPHWIPQGTIRHSARRLRIRLTLFDNRRKSILHPWGISRISLNTKDENLKQKVEKLGFKTRKGKLTDWRLEIAKLNYGKLEQIATQLESIDAEIEVVRSACLTNGKRMFFQPASHAREKMLITIEKNGKIVEETIKKVEREKYTGQVYDLDIENVHNYIANNFVVHNSIYAFRGSDLRNFLRFDRDWPEATVIKLEENYRSTGNILSAATNIIKNNKMQRPKTLWTKKGEGELITITGVPTAEDEAYYIISQISQIFSFNKNAEIAILYRTNAQSRPIEQALLQNNIPYNIYGGLKFYERMEIKDVLCALQFAGNPQNSRAAERIRKNFGKKEGDFLLLHLPRMSKEKNIVELIDFFLESTKYFEYLEKNYKNYYERIENINELIAFAGTFITENGLQNFVEQASLVSSLDAPNGRTRIDNGNPPSLKLRRGEPATNTVNLMTVHSAKGLEFGQVFLVGCNEGLMPHERSFQNADELEEERRLMYVATTRAREKLFITFYNTPSRFLYEIPAGLTVFKNNSMTPRRELSSFEDEDFISYD